MGVSGPPAEADGGSGMGGFPFHLSACDKEQRPRTLLKEMIGRLAEEKRLARVDPDPENDQRHALPQRRARIASRRFFDVELRNRTV